MVGLLLLVDFVPMVDPIPRLILYVCNVANSAPESILIICINELASTPVQ